ncbi:leucine-rich repeat domain-containing protein [Bacterioplanoides pacificum]|uniref:Leucine-rich repeat domain-containing protein n=1 Tax=Bacterioplanoides pacificum TaxID=1171596 RepID=A0ABV7VMG7_9GAMM
MSSVYMSRRVFIVFIYLLLAPYAWSQKFMHHDVPISEHDAAQIKKLAAHLGVPEEKFGPATDASGKVFISNSNGNLLRDKNNNDIMDEEESVLEYKAGVFLSYLMPYQYALSDDGDIWYLNMSFSDFSDLSMLSGFKNLKVFECDPCKIKDIDVKKESSIEYINLGETVIDSITDVSGFKKLQYISLDYYGNDLSNFKLDNIRWLDLKARNINNISFLKSFERLKYLYLWVNDDDEYDLSMLPEGLTRFILSGGEKSTNFSSIGRLTDLRDLDLRSDALSNTSFLSKLKNLEYLFISDSPNINKVDGLEFLDNLEEIYLVRIPIDSISAIRSLKNLKHIDISDTNITSLDGVQNKPFLKTISVIASPIKRIEHLEGLPKLNELILVNTDIKKIEGLENLNCLEDLNLYDNDISVFENIFHLPLLSEMNLDKTKVYEFPGWEKTQRLRIIHMNEREFKKRQTDPDYWYNYVPYKDFDWKLRMTPLINNKEREKYGCYLKED